MGLSTCGGLGGFQPLLGLLTSRLLSLQTNPVNSLEKMVIEKVKVCKKWVKGQGHLPDWV